MSNFNLASKVMEKLKKGEHLTLSVCFGCKIVKGWIHFDYGKYYMSYVCKCIQIRNQPITELDIRDMVDFPFYQKAWGVENCDHVWASIGKVYNHKDGVDAGCVKCGLIPNEEKI